MSEQILSVKRALEILDLLYNNGEEMGISAIGRELGLHKSTVHRTLTTLESMGFVYQNSENGMYWLGLKIYTMGLSVGNKISLVDIIKPYSKMLYNEFKEVVNISMLDKDPISKYKTVIIHKEVDTSKALSVNPDVGSRSFIHASSVGKCLLAFSKDISIEKLSSIPLYKFTDNTITSWNELNKELDKVRLNGYAIDNEEQELGLYCIGAPILDKSGNAIAAISISGPTVRMKIGNMDEKIKKVVYIAKEISKNIG